jgi:hypothetical protein
VITLPAGAMFGIAATRFWKKVEKTNDCWWWTGARDERGYGRFSIGRSQASRLAHRVAWLFSGGTLEGEALLLHRCDNPSCVRPSHLFVGTQVDNMRDANRKGRTKGTFRPKTACINGHPLTHETTGVRGKRRERYCLECSRASCRRYRARLRG